MNRKTDRQPRDKRFMEQDVKSMSYDDLMAAVRYLDAERKSLSRSVSAKAMNENTKPERTKDAAA